MLASKTVEIKSRAEIDSMREAGKIVAEILSELSLAAVSGVTTGDLDRLARRGLAARKAEPAFLGYRGFPAALCVSVNSEVVHGIPSNKRKIVSGDIVSLDFGAIVRGFFADAAVTIGVGKISSAAESLIRATKESLAHGISAVKDGARIGDVSSAVQRCAETAGFSVVRDFVGHGIGRALHEEPAVPNYGKPGTGPRIVPGMVLAIEPMINAGSPDVEVLADGWTAVTTDGALSAHFEHTVALTENGPEILTYYDQGR
ncbi:MAG: type I methionyl aminopeptidase [Elusimicrobiota bacterium]